MIPRSSSSAPGPVGLTHGVCPAPPRGRLLNLEERTEVRAYSRGQQPLARPQERLGLVGLRGRHRRSAPTGPAGELFHERHANDADPDRRRTSPHPWSSTAAGRYRDDPDRNLEVRGGRMPARRQGRVRRARRRRRDRHGERGDDGPEERLRLAVTSSRPTAPRARCARCSTSTSSPSGSRAG